MKFSLLSKSQLWNRRSESYKRLRSTYKMTFRRLRQNFTLIMMSSQYHKKMLNSKSKIGSLNLRAKNSRRDGEERILASMNCLMDSMLMIQTISHYFNEYY
jgi:replicative DNA helicase